MPIPAYLLLNAHDPTIPMIASTTSRDTARPKTTGASLFSEFASKRPFPKDAEIGVQGQHCNTLYLIVDGQVLLTRSVADGQAHAIDLLGPGDLFGEGALQEDARWPATARAMTPVSTHVLPAAQLLGLAQYYPQVAGHLFRLLGARLERAHRGAELAKTSCARERTLRLLQLLAEYHGQRDGKEVWLPISLTQAQLGQLAQLKRETIVRTLGELEKRGMIRRCGRSGLWLRSPTVPILERTLGQPHPSCATPS